MSSITLFQPELNYQVDSFITKLKRRQIVGSSAVAIETAQLLIRVVSASKWKNPDHLIKQIRRLGVFLTESQPKEFTCGNIVRRVLSLIRDEIDDTQVGTKLNQPIFTSMFNLLIPTDEQLDKINKQNDGYIELKSKLDKPDRQFINSFRSTIIQDIKELIDEINHVDEGLEHKVIELIHDDEVLLTPTPTSQTVLNFLKKARQKRRFTVVVTESFPNHTLTAHKFAKELADSNIETIVIPDSSVYALMSRVGKVIIGAKTVFKNGGCITSPGVSAVCEIAKELRTPVFSVTAIYKLTPQYSFDTESLVEFGNPGYVIPFQESDMIQNSDISNPIIDYVPPENISIYITNLGGFAPNFVYHMVQDNYKNVDFDLN
ncbi:translation initiation factor eIF2B subunit beta [Ascoidea rubescens DSM 1968]|uniref:Translation initiation factor eIF2B subunit beta n=1 Tax=Ascoidea rubescens DSM 1968 TaxID=1344418 RepID=A0A1D2VFM0_9ASCO|nr:IF-2B-domain-containing protein [Ascoidea rubescens DSM 1968]ODV60382.1 IF-2B-domain-containing protein [Ascoidea rubescens DSM 1968]